jgi:hypothetical protein
MNVRPDCVLQATQFVDECGFEVHLPDARSAACCRMIVGEVR